MWTYESHPVEEPGHMPPVQVVKLPNYPEDLPVLTRATEEAVGVELYAAIAEKICTMPGDRVLIPTGLKVALPVGYELQIRPRSGLAWNQGLTVLNTPGTIDPDYRGEVGVIILNSGTGQVYITPKMKIAQGVFCRYEVPEIQVVEALNETTRGEGGFGSTGV
jgi:dUTP pyrophosphatase